MEISTIILISVVAIAVFALVFGTLSRYKRCPSDKVLVVYGKVGSTNGKNSSSRCIHGGAAFVWPVFQNYSYLDLTPISLKVNVTSALSKQNIRVNVPSQFTVGISTEESVMSNAAERLLGLTPQAIQTLSNDIILGQMRLIIATMNIEEINADRDKFLSAIQQNVETELKKIGLKLINVNIVDIEDEAGYIQALGQEAASQAINDAKKVVAEKNRDGEIGQANARQDQITQVSKANASAEVGKADADKQQRIKMAEANASAIEGENKSAILIADSEALKRERMAEAHRRAVSSEKVQAAKALEDSYAAETLAERARAAKEQAQKEADFIVNATIAKQQAEINAEAEAEVARRKARGDADAIISLAKAEADAIFLKAEAEAKGINEMLNKQAEGFAKLVEASGGDARSAVMYLMTKQLPELVSIQVEAIKNIKIDKVTVWDSGNGDGGATPNFLKGMLGSVPPLNDVFDMVGTKLPKFIENTPDSGDVMIKS